MSLKLTIENGIKDAMRAKDADRLRALRAIKSLILLEDLHYPYLMCIGITN